MNISIRKTYNPPDLSFLNTKNKFMSFFAGFIDGDGSFSNSKSVSLKIQCHKNWLDNFKYIKNRLDEIIDNNINVYIDDKDYVSFTTSNQTFLSKLKIMVEKLNIPIMERKWNRIDINNISDVDNEKNKNKLIMKLNKEGKKLKEIAEIIGYTDNSMRSYFNRNKIKYNK